MKMKKKAKAPKKTAKKTKNKAKPAKKAAKKVAKKAVKKPVKKVTRPSRKIEAPLPTNANGKPKRRAGVTDIGEASPDAEFEVKIQNIVAFTDLGTKISLEKVLQKLENTEYQPEQFPGLIYRMQSPRASALVFSQGKIVCTGTKSMQALKEAMQQIVKNLRSVGFRLPQKYTTTVENIVASSAIDADLNLDEIAFQLENSEYEPEQFPGLVYRISQPRVAFLLFKSGRIIITGGRTIMEIHEALGIFKKNLEALGVKLKPSKSKT
jgi:transcription initiation factor TFIID TATA-box-binding protein